MIGNRKRIFEALAFGLAACGFGCFSAYGANEQFASAAGIGSGLRCIPELIKAATIAAISGAPTLAKLTPMVFNTATNKWQIWTATLDSYTLTSTATGGNFTLTVNGETTGNIAYNATASTILTALLALGNIDQGDLTVTGNMSGSVIAVSSTGKLAGTAVTVSITDSTTGGTTTIAHTTTGVAGTDGSGGIAFVWPEAVATDATNETLANLLFAGDIHLDDIVVPSGETLDNLKIMLQKYARKLDFNIQGLVQYH